MKINDFVNKRINYIVTPPLDTKAQVLPLQEIPWEFFEVLCCRLTLKNSEYLDPNIYGIKGNKQHGIDILARKKSSPDKYATFQCKQVKSFTPRAMHKAVEEFLIGDFKDNSKEFIIYTSFNCRSKKLRDEKEKQISILSANGVAFELWDDEKISVELKNYPDLVYDFFGREWMLRFLGEEKTKKFFEEHIDYKIVEETKKILLDKPEFYLERKVIKPEELEKENFYFKNYSNYKLLYDILETPVRIALISEAANGKSTELRNISHLVSADSGKLFPIFYSLGDYTDENIADLIPEPYRKLPIQNLLFILDGLDEAPFDKRQTITNKIKTFCSSNPRANFIVSVRENFYTYNDKTKASTIENFERYKLTRLTGQQIDKYLNDNLTPYQKKDFDTQVEVKNLVDLVYSPFYIISLVNIFKKSGTLPGRKAEIFEILLSESFDFDKEHFEGVELEPNKLLLTTALTKIALVMELIEKQKISEDEIQKVIKDTAIRKMLYCSSILKKIGDNYEFIHNNFREYLCAKALSVKEFPEIKQFLFIKDKINQKRVNVLSFLFSILEKDSQLFDDIFKNLSDNDLEILVKVEHDKLSKEQRFEIFKRIYENHKTKKIFIDRDVFNHRKLAYFAESHETTEYLLNEIKTINIHYSKCNAIEIIGYFKNTSAFSKDIEKIFIEELKKGDSYVIFSVLMSLGNLKLNDKKIIDKVIIILKDDERDYVRAGLYYFLLRSNYLDEYIDELLKGIPVHRYHWSQHSTKSETRIGDERINLVNGLERISSPEGLKKLLTYFTVNPKDFRDIYFHQFDKIAHSLNEAYKIDNTIFDFVLKLVHSLESEHIQGDELEMLYTFIETTGNSLKAYYSTENIKTEDYYKGVTLSKLSNKEILEDLLVKNGKKKISDKYIIDYLYNVKWKNPEEFDEQYKLANERGKNKFLITFRPRKDYEGLRKEGFENYLKLLFDKDKYFEHVDKLIKEIGKTDFTKEDLNKLWSENSEKDLPEDFVLEEMVRDTRRVKPKDLLDFYKMQPWDDYIIESIYVYMTNGFEVILSKEQREFIENWCVKYLQLDFKNCLQLTAKHITLCDERCKFVWYFLRHFNLKFPKEKLLDLLSFDMFEKSDWVGIKYLETLLPPDDIKERVLQNIAGGSENRQALHNQIDYCFRHKIKEVTPYLINVISDTKAEYMTRKLAYDTFIALSDSIQELLDILVALDYLKWEIIYAIYKSNKGGVEKELLEIFNSTGDDDKLRAAGFLVLHGNLNALKHIVDLHKKENRVVSFKWSIEYSPFNVIKNPDFLPLLFDLLDTVYDPGFKVDEFYSIENTLLTVFQRIALNNDEEAFQKTVSELKNFIKQNSHKNPKIDFINRTIDDIERQNRINEGDTLDLKSANKVADLILKDD